MGRLLYWVTITYTARHHAHYHSAGNGHLYQGRYKSFPIQDDKHFFVVMRYVERRALAAGLVRQAEEQAKRCIARGQPFGSNQLLVEPILNRPYESEVTQAILPILPIRLLTPFTSQLPTKRVD